MQATFLLRHVKKITYNKKRLVKEIKTNTASWLRIIMQYLIMSRNSETKVHNSHLSAYEIVSSNLAEDCISIWVHLLLSIWQKSLCYLLMAGKSLSYFAQELTTEKPMISSSLLLFLFVQVKWKWTVVWPRFCIVASPLWRIKEAPHLFLNGLSSLLLLHICCYELIINQLGSADILFLF